jgi:ATP-dependent Lhr-like helicase
LRKKEPRALNVRFSTSTRKPGKKRVKNADGRGEGFYYLHPLMQRKLYDMGWTELRPIQEAAIRAFFEGNRDLIVSADTAGGKTEAAFLPVLSQILRDREKKILGLRALYVSPLRALINDQFDRLEDLCKRAEIPVFKWHGDVPSPRKKKFLAAPKGVLLVTPESIESLFLNHAEHVASLFKNVSWLVLDELHSFMGTERGAHLKSLLSRIDRIKAHPVRLLALSATIGDFEVAKAWLRWGSRMLRSDGSAAPGPELLTAPDDGREILYRLKGYQRQASFQEPHSGPEVPGLSGGSDYVADLIRLFPSTSLVFVNSKRMLEHLTYTVQKVAEERRLPNRYRVHHGSLSKVEREDTEEALKTKTGTVTFCSSTLELGIDVGNVERVGQFGAPWSVNVLRQRLGRSGRRDGAPSAMVLFIVDKSEQESLIEKIHPELLQAVAMSELMFQRWCESPDIDQPHYSTLVQQCMSVIAEKGGISARKLYSVLVEDGAFSHVPRAVFCGS